MSSGILSEKEIEELREFRERARKLNKLKAARRREKKTEAGLKQLNIWVTESEAELIRRFTKFIRTTPVWRLSSFDDATQKWATNFLHRPEIS